MNSKDFYYLTEAYQEIYSEEKKPFPFKKVNKQMIKARISGDNIRHMQMNTAKNRAIKQGEEEPSPEQMAINKRVRLIRGLNKEEFDALSNYLISESFCETFENAENIINSMSSDWIFDILESKY